MATLNWPPLTPTLWMPPIGARHTAVTVSVSGGGEATTLTFTDAVEVPKLSVTVSWKVRTDPAGMPTVLKFGVRVPEVGFSPAAGPAVCAQVIVGAVALGSCVTVPARVSERPVATTKSMPALAIGPAPPAGEQVTAGGVGLPGHGVSWPTTVPNPKSGPEPCARKGKSWRLFGRIGSPSLKFSGKMKSKLGNRYWPEPRPLANPTGKVGRVGSNGSLGGVVPVWLWMIISRVGGMNWPPNTWKRKRPRTGWVRGSTVPRSRSVSTPVHGFTSTALTSMRFTGSVVNPTMKMRVVASWAMVFTEAPPLPSRIVSTLT